MELIKFNELKNQLEQIQDIEQLIDFTDKIKVFGEWAKIKDESIELQNSIFEFRLRGERKIGEWVKENIRRGGDHGNQYQEAKSTIPTLADLNISKDESTKMKKIADIPDGVFEEHIQEIKENNEKLTLSGLLKGKNFSANNQGQRNKSDFYQTPYSMTEQLFKNEDFFSDQTILEPAKGKGAIVKILKERFTAVRAFDLSDGVDFITGKIAPVDVIITNPPFSKSFEFIQKAKEICTDKFAMLLPLSYLHGQKRYDERIFTDENFTLARIHVFTRYPMLSDEIRGDGKYETGMMVYAWFVWDKKHVGDPTINWINNNDYILKK